MTDEASRPALAGELAALLGGVDRLAQIEDLDSFTREAVEFARESLGIERVCIYLVEDTEPEVVLRGTWGTSDRGVTIDERRLAHIYAREEFEGLQKLHARGELWAYHSLEPQTNDRRRLPWTREDRDWLATTPLVYAREIVAVFYNDTGMSKAPLDATKQAKLAVFGGLLAGLTKDRLARQPLNRSGTPVPMTSRFIHKVLYDLEREPHLSGEELAERFRVSAGHLARTFKAEVGCSLVEYRNRLRLVRFFAIMRTGKRSLLEAATQAGFGSYAQFLRVHRQLTGLAPRDYSSNGHAAEE